MDNAKFYIGQHPVYIPIIISPMSGISDIAFRLINYKYAEIDLAVSEMILANQQLLSTGVNEALIVDCLKLVDNKPNAFNWLQIIGHNPEQMGNLSKFINNQGAAQVIDINFGCPAKKVVKKAAGSALMADTKSLFEIVKKVLANSKVPVTIKMRTGVDSRNKNALEIAKQAQLIGVSAISIHGRTRQQLYKSHAEYQTIKEIKQSLSIPVIANGDIDSIEKMQYVFDHTGVDGVMIGRYALGNPWLLAKLIAFYQNKPYQEPTIVEKFQVVIEHIELLNQYYDARYALNNARKHFIWYLENIFGNVYSNKGYNNHKNNAKPGEIFDLEALESKLNDIVTNQDNACFMTQEQWYANELASKKQTNFNEQEYIAYVKQQVLDYFNANPQYVEKKARLIKSAKDTILLDLIENTPELLQEIASWKSEFNRLQNNQEQLVFLYSCLAFLRILEYDLLKNNT